MEELLRVLKRADLLPAGQAIVHPAFSVGMAGREEYTALTITALTQAGYQVLDLTKTHGVLMAIDPSKVLYPNGTKVLS